MLLTPGQVLRDRYRIDSVIGHGGMADVYLAFDLRRQSPLAIKVLHEDLAEDPEFLHRFQREAEALERLHHPNIVRFYSFERHGRTAFIVMDYVPGTTLRGRLADAGGPLPVAEATSILRDIASALYYAHAEGIIHRDLKPGNIMLRDDGRALLSDFGIAKIAESATVTTMAVGAPAYMSPEQISGRPVDARSDIYSLGATLYETAAGRRPFTGETGTGTTTMARLRDEHLHRMPPDPRTFNPAIPAEVAAVLLRALEKDPDKRWPDVLALAAAWEAAAGTAPAPVSEDTTMVAPAHRPAATPPPPSRATDTGSISPRPVPPPITPVQAPPPAGQAEQQRIPPPARAPSARRYIPLLIGLAAFLLVVVFALGAVAWSLISKTRGNDKVAQRATATAPAATVAGKQPSATLAKGVSPQATSTGAAAPSGNQPSATPENATALPGKQPSGTPNPSSGQATATGAPNQPTATSTATLPPTPTPLSPTATPKPTAVPAPAVPRGRIAYTVNKGPYAYDIYIINLDGTGKQLLVADASEPFITRDGQVIFYSWQGGGVDIMRLDGSNRRRVINDGEAAFANVASDGYTVVYMTGEVNWDTWAFNMKIATIGLDGQGKRTLTEGDQPAWSPVAMQFVCKTCDGSKCGLFLMNSDGSGRRKITDGANDQNATWSPDGSQITFASDRTGNWEIYVMNADGSNIRRLTDNPTTDALPLWLPDGQHIAFRSDRGGVWSIYVMDVWGGGVTKVTDAQCSTQRWRWERMAYQP